MADLWVTGNDDSTTREELLGQPRPAPGFRPCRIVLTRGSKATLERTQLVEKICQLYPSVQPEALLDLPHNRVRVAGEKLIERHARGKRALVFGEHRSAVRLSQESDNTCPDYWHFSPYGFCPYDCKYCYLAGTQGVRFSPTVKIFLNLPEILQQVDATARRLHRPVGFYVGKLQDAMALDPLTGYSRIMVPFFADHPLARLILLTKSSDVDNLIDLRHARHTILSWSLNPPEIWERFEASTPHPLDRIEAMHKCAEAGYPVRAVIMPIIPVPEWEGVYGRFLSHLLGKVALDRVTLGGICSYPAARQIMEAKLGRTNAISEAMRASSGRGGDGRSRYPLQLRIEVYRHIIDSIRDHAPDTEIGLCLEERRAFEALGMAGSIGRCNCVL